MRRINTPISHLSVCSHFRILQLLDPNIEYYLVFEYLFRLDSYLITFPSNHLALFHRIGLLGQLRNCLYKTHHIIFVQTLPGGWTVQSIQQPVPSPDKRGGLASGRASGHKTFAIKSKCRDSQRIRVGLGRTP